MSGGGARHDAPLGRLDGTHRGDVFVKTEHLNGSVRFGSFSRSMVLLRMKQELAREDGNVLANRRKGLQNLLNHLLEGGYHLNENNARVVKLLMTMPTPHEHWKKVVNHVKKQIEKGESISPQALLTVPLEGPSEDVRHWLDELQLMIQDVDDSGELALPYLKVYFKHGEGALPDSRRKKMEALVAELEGGPYTLDQDTIPSVKLFATMPIPEEAWQAIYQGLFEGLKQGKKLHVDKNTPLIPDTVARKTPYRKSADDNEKEAYALLLVNHLQKALKPKAFKTVDRYDQTEHYAEFAHQDMSGSFRRDDSENTKDPNFELNLQLNQQDNALLGDRGDDVVKNMTINYFGKLEDSPSYCEMTVENIDYKVFSVTSYNQSLLKAVKALMRSLEKQANFKK